MPDRYFEPPTPYTGGHPSVFLAGGITGCPNWQTYACALLGNDVTILNPRCAQFPIDDPTAACGQIEWEFHHLAKATVVLFWFPASGTVTQPIALYELGYHAAAGTPITVGVDPDYIRADDVQIQIGLARPDVPVWGSVAATVRHTRRLLAAGGWVASVDD